MPLRKWREDESDLCGDQWLEPLAPTTRKITSGQIIELKAGTNATKFPKTTDFGSGRDVFCVSPKQ